MGEHRRPGAREALDEGADDGGQSDFAEISERQTGDGDADLNAGNHAAEVADEMLDDFRARVALLDELANAREPDGDQRKFGGREKGVHADQENDAEDVQRAHRPKSLTAKSRHVRRF